MDFKTERLRFLAEGVAEKPFPKLLGVEFVSIDTGMCVLKIPKKKELMRPSGIFNGGVLVSLMDITAGIAAAATGKEMSDYYVTTDLNTQFLRPADGGCIRCHADVIKEGKHLIVVKAMVFSVKETEEVLCTMGTFTFMKIR